MEGDCLPDILGQFFGEIGDCVMICDGYRPSTQGIGGEEGLPRSHRYCATFLGNFRSDFALGQSRPSEAAVVWDQLRDFQAVCAFCRGRFVETR